MTNPAVEAAGAERERFAAPASRWFGWAAVVLAVVIAGAVAIDGPVGGFRGLTAMAALVLLTWVVLIRPSAALHEHGVLLRNMVRDIFVPFSTITDAEVTQTLEISTDEQTFRGLGVSKTARTIRRERAGLDPHGIGMQPASRDNELVRRGDMAIGGSYQGYVGEQILKSVETAGPDGGKAVVVTSLPSVAALVGATVLTIVTFV